MKQHFIRLAKSIVERFPTLAMTYRFIRDSSHFREDPRDTGLGFRLAGNRQMQDGNFEPEETKIVQAVLSSVDVVINVGANIGYYCCIALSKKKHVVAFEPIQLNLGLLLRNVRANGWESQIEVFPLALGDRTGIVEIFGGGTGASLVKGWAGTAQDYGALVPCSTMDTVLGSRFEGNRTLIIVDVEGAELMMLAGASYALNMTPRPIWMMEITASQHQPKGIRMNPNLLATFQMFWNRGYEAWTADRECRAITPDDIRKIVESGESSLSTHNFLFIEGGRRREVLPAN